MPTLDAITPIVPVSDDEASVAFYRDVLGFELRFRDPDRRYALLAREQASVMVLGGADEDTLRATATNISAYVWVTELGALWDELEPKLSALPDGRVRPPFFQGYGMREFHVKDPDGFLIFFGETAENEGEQ